MIKSDGQYLKWPIDQDLSLGTWGFEVRPVPTFTGPQIWYAPTNEVGGGLETPPTAMPTRSGVPHPKKRRGKPGGDLTDSFENREEGGRDLSKPSRFFSCGPNWPNWPMEPLIWSLLVFNYHQLPILAGRIETYPSPSEAHELPPLLQIQKIGTSEAFTWWRIWKTGGWRWRRCNAIYCRPGNISRHKRWKTHVSEYPLAIKPGFTASSICFWESQFANLDVPLPSQLFTREYLSRSVSE